MTSKKDLFVAIVATFCLTATLFLIIPTRSQSQPRTYDPWVDTNDDGTIDIYDAIILSSIFGTSGTPVNKTALLLELESRVDSLNSSLLNLEAYFNTRITTLEAMVAEQQVRIADLETELAVLNAPYAIPFNLTYNDLHNFTTETAGFVDMPSTSVTLTLNRTSQLLIMFSANAWMSNATSNPSAFIKCQAVVNGTPATPSVVQLTPTMTAELGDPYRHAHRVTNSTCNFTFYSDSLSAGTYTIQIRWYISSQGQGDVGTRTLAVMVLPT